MADQVPLVQLDDEKANRAQSLLNQKLNKLSDVPFSNGRMVTIQLGIGSNQVQHKLGRAWQGWFITKRNTPATVYDAQGSVDPKSFLVLVASATCDQQG